MCQLIGDLISYTSYGMCKRPIPHSFQIQKVRFKLINKTISNRKVLHTCKRVCNIFCCGRPHKNISLSDNITSGIKLSSSTGCCPPSLIIPKSICSSAQIFAKSAGYGILPGWGHNRFSHSPITLSRYYYANHKFFYHKRIP